MTVRSPISIEAVDSKRKRNDFYEVRRSLYRKDPAAVIPLQSLEWSLLDVERHPFYQHARRQVWVAYRGGKPVGRIVASVDDMHNEHYRDRTGFFGFFETIDDIEIAGKLLETARDWLRAEGCDAIRGPVSPSMKGEFGVLTDGHQYPPFIMMAHSRDYYARLLLEFGMKSVKKFHSFLYVPDEDNHEALKRFARLGEVCQKLQKRFPELQIRLGTPQTLEPMLREINRIGNIIRSRGWGFVPLTEAELVFMVSQLRRIIDPETVIGAYIDDQMVGYNVSIPNLNWAIKQCRGRYDWMRYPQLMYWMRRIPEIRLIAVGVDPGIRAKGISALVTKSMTDQWHKFRRWEFGWIAEDNLASMDALDRALPLRKYKTYEVFEMKIGDQGPTPGKTPQSPLAVK